MSVACFCSSKTLWRMRATTATRHYRSVVGTNLWLSRGTWFSTSPLSSDVQVSHIKNSNNASKQHQQHGDEQQQPRRTIPKDGLGLQDFVQGTHTTVSPTKAMTTWREPVHPLVSGDEDDNHNPPSINNNKTFHLKTYGCQMNVNDSDIVRSLLQEAGFLETEEEEAAEILLTNTCAIREGAEAKVWHRLRDIKGRWNRRHRQPRHRNQSAVATTTKLQEQLARGTTRRRPIVGLLGCMAERLKEDLFQDGLVDLVVGPDAYRDLPRLVQSVQDTANLTQAETPEEVQHAVNVQLSLDETYADITPIRRPSNSTDVAAFVSIQRGCANRCSFCIVPFTRGQERSRPLESIVEEIQRLHWEEGVKEVTLLGQNVNSYHDTSDDALRARPHNDYALSNDGFRSRQRKLVQAGYYFADLVAAVSDISPELRVRFTSPHPKDYPDSLLDLMAERPNVCQHLHMPAQSGSTHMLQRMKRGYSREAYLSLLEDSVLPRLPDVALSSDFIAGFCGETEKDHRETVSLLERVRYDQAFLFAYSLREQTHAHRVYQDDVPPEIKQQRLQELIDTFHHHVQIKNTEQELGQLRLVLLEGPAKRKPNRSKNEVWWHGRTDQNKRILFPVDVDDASTVQSGWDAEWHPWVQSELNSLVRLPSQLSDNTPSWTKVPLQAGDYGVVHVTEVKGHTLRGKLLWRTTLQAFAELESQTDQLSLRLRNDQELRVRLSERVEKASSYPGWEEDEAAISLGS